MTSVIAFVITVDWLLCEVNCQALLGGDDIVLGKGALSYRSVYHGNWNHDRILLLFYKKNNSSIYCRRRAYEHGIQQVRRTHCEQGAPSPKNEFITTYSKGRWNCRLVDLSRKYFSLQMNGLLDKGAKSIRIRVFEFASPAVDTGIHRVENMAEMGAEVRELTRTHVWGSLNLQIDLEISLLVGYLLHQWFYRWWYVLGQRIKVFLGYKSERSCLRLTCLHSLTCLFSDRMLLSTA